MKQKQLHNLRDRDTATTIYCTTLQYLLNQDENVISLIMKNCATHNGRIFSVNKFHVKFVRNQTVGKPKNGSQFSVTGIKLMLMTVQKRSNFNRVPTAYY